MENRVFKCSICNKEYMSPMARANCELACCKKLEEENKKAAELKKMEEKMASEANVTAAFDAAYELRDEHVAKYGSYSYTRKEPVTNKIHSDYPTLGDVLNFIF